MANDIEIAWFAGLMEGEGGFHLSNGKAAPEYPRISLAMLDKDIVDRAAVFLHSNVTTYATPKGDKLMYRCSSAKPEIIKPLLESIYPYLGERRKVQVDTMFAMFNRSNDNS